MSYKKQTWAVSEQAKPEKMKHIEDGIAANDTAISGLSNALNGKESLQNKTTVINGNSTDTEYPSAKAVYDAIHAIPSGGSSDGVITPVSISSNITMQEVDS